MKYFFLILFFTLISLNSVCAQTTSDYQTKTSLAIRYYNAKEYEKAMPLLKEVYDFSKSRTYFRYYLTCLVGLKKLPEAEREIQKEIKKQKLPKPEFYIYWGNVLKIKGENEAARQKYREALKKVNADKSSYLLLANTFFSYREYEMAKKTYLQGREILKREGFTYELALAYMYLRDYKNMMRQYLELLSKDERQLPRVQNRLAVAMRLDVDNTLRKQFREQLLLRIQAQPDVVAYNRLLIWFFLQEKKFTGALQQCMAIDKRTGAEAGQIAQIGNIALQNRAYAMARKAYAYLMDKGPENSYYDKAYSKTLNAAYLEFVHETPNNAEKGVRLANQFEKGLEYLKNNVYSFDLIQEYAHLLTFYLERPNRAIDILKQGLNRNGLTQEQIGVLKTEMADTYVYANDPWEAMLIYSQVISNNKNNSLGDEVKLKKAKLGYYMGNFSWAKAQLDVLKASTSKLTANDAMELSLMISSNLNLDTTVVPLSMFSRADLRFFQNKKEEALAILDSLAKLYPYNPLVDDILFRKAKLAMRNQDYEKAAGFLQTITDDFAYELSGDDALFLLAEIYNYHLNQKEKAKQLYRNMLTRYPGSIYVEESRKKYRELRKIYPDKEEAWKNVEKH